MEHLHYGSIHSPVMGEIFAAASGRGLCRVTYGQSEAAFVEELYGVSGARPQRDDAALAAILGQLAEYLSGRLRRFDCQLDLSGRTDFQQRVLCAVREIPWGELLTYGEVAEEAGRPGAARA